MDKYLLMVHDFLLISINTEDL